MIPKPFFEQKDPHLRQIGWWLIIVAALVFAMFLVGGATRLTQSGLSIVEWKPIAGTIPPLSEEAWMEEFAAYQAYPEYVKLNQGMSLDEFKGIYWWEFWHRNLGRLIGLCFMLPLLFFIAKRRIPPDLKPRMFVLLILGAAQGALGWWMVASGLIDRPSVSHYRLAAHLAMAVLLLSALLWTAGQVLQARVLGEKKERILTPFMTGFTALIAIQLIWGAFVAGLDAGYLYNDWPLMAGHFTPEDMWRLSPAWLNFLDNQGGVQFIHRMIAYLLFFLADIPLLIAIFSKRPKCVITLSVGLAGLVFLQVLVGIITLMMVVPVSLGVLHQGLGILLYAYALYFVFACRGKVYGQS